MVAGIPIPTGMITHIPMITDLALLRLLHLVSPTLPIGSFTYSQGIEWAVECGWIATPADLQNWLASQLHSGMTHLDIPVLQRLYHAVERAMWNAGILIHTSTPAVKPASYCWKKESRAGTDRFVDCAGNPQCCPLETASRPKPVRRFRVCRRALAIPLQQTAYGYVELVENLVLSAVKSPAGANAGAKNPASDDAAVA